MKKKVIHVVLGGLIVLILAACGGNDSASGSNGSSSENGSGENSAPSASAEELFGQSCSSCHGEDLKSGYAPDLDKIGSKYSAEEIQDIIANGTGAMPKGVIKGEEAEIVAEWLASKN